MFHGQKDQQNKALDRSATDNDVYDLIQYITGREDARAGSGFGGTTLILRRATESDIRAVSEMNKQLIIDEGSPNPMTIDELEQRMKDWMLTDWAVDLICDADSIVGYALYQFRTNPYDPQRQEVYLRQYFIQSGYRNRGFGREGIELLLKGRFQEAERVVIDVLEDNLTGKSFWKKTGFSAYYTNMRRTIGTGGQK
jgi:predicted acetyltransferase